MGRMQAEEFAALASAEVALGWHLQSNHFPPVPLHWNPVCAAAIEACNEGDFEREIDLPDGVTRKGDDRPVDTAASIAETFRLGPFIYYGEEA